jgi:CubicO group peptidase (beta-lactamase class C family)
MNDLDRRRFLVVLGAGIAAPRALLAATSSEAIAQRLEDATRDGKVSGLHALLVSAGGKPVFAHYGHGEDVAWDRLLGDVTFGPEVLHDLRSVSKSVVGLAYGVALAAGKVPPPDAKLYDQFPEFADLAGTSVVPADWVKRVTTPVVPTSNIRSYGYHWYMGDYAAGTAAQPLHWFGGVGWGGQYLFVIPARDLVIVIHCGNYRRTGADQTAVMRTIMTEVVLPSFI